MDYRDDYNMYEEYREEEKREYPVKHMNEEKKEFEDGMAGEEYDLYPDGYEKDHKRLIEVERIIDLGWAETTLEVCVPLCPPAFEVFENLIGRKIEIDIAIASHGKIFINGRIIKNIPYKTKCESVYPPCRNISRLTYGNVKHATFEAPFALCINAPNARKGDKVVILEKKVTSVEIPSPARCGVCVPEIYRRDVCMRRPIMSVTEKDCIFIKAKAVRPMITHLPKECY